MNLINYYFHQLVSIIFHPLLMAFYMLFIMNLINPYEFVSFQGTDKHLLFFQVIISTIILPGIAIIMMYSLGLIRSVELGDSKERMFPFIAAAIFYLWLFANLVFNPLIPNLYNVLIFGAILGLFSSMVINLFIKLSIHCLAVGMLMSGIFLMYLDWLNLFGREQVFSEKSMIILIVLVVLIAGLVGSARLHLKIHTLKEVYTGYLIGIVSPVISYFTLDYIFYG